MTPDEDFFPSLSSFALDVRVQADSTDKTATFRLQYSLNGGTNFTVAPTPTVTGWGNTVIDVPARTGIGGTRESTATYDLSGVGTVGDEFGVIFRIYASAVPTSDKTNSIQRYDNIVVTGTVMPVPEPTRVAILAGAGLIGLGALSFPQVGAGGE